MGAFPPPVKNAGDACCISDHNDIGVGLNAKSTHPEEAKKFLDWVASPEFADIYANALPGFFSLNSTRGEDAGPARAGIRVLAREMQADDPLDLPDSCRAARRTFENETWVESANVINGTDTPEAAAKKLQDGLDSWFKPAK